MKCSAKQREISTSALLATTDINKEARGVATCRARREQWRLGCATISPVTSSRFNRYNCRLHREDLAKKNIQALFAIGHSGFTLWQRDKLYP